MRFTLHIGRHKTGTSSLQRFLVRNRKQLERRGFYYPKSGMEALGHHELARQFMRGHRPLAAPADPTQSACVKALLAETAGRTDRILLSSEGFQNCDPRLVGRVFGANETTVVVYLREQVGYLVSAYQQRVQASNYAGSLEEFAAEFSVDYDAFLHRWERVYGRERVIARLYGPTLLKDGDIIADFCSAVGVGRIMSLVRPTSDSNPSIGGALLEFKRIVNVLLPRPKTPLALYSALAELADGDAPGRLRPELRAQTVSGIRQASRDANARVFDRYPGMVEGFGATDDDARADQARPLPAVELIAQAEQFERQYPAQSEAILQAARHRLPQLATQSPLNWPEVIAAVELTSNRYLDVEPARHGGAATRTAMPAARVEQMAAETQRHFVQSLFLGILRRSPRDNELAHWTRALATDVEPWQLPAHLMESDEFGHRNARPGTDTTGDLAYVEAVFRGVLRRPPREAEVARWTELLDSGMDPRQLPSRLISGKEFERIEAASAVDAQADRAFIAAVYRGLLRRAPRDTEFEHWLGQLARGLDPRRLVERLAASEEAQRIDKRWKALWVPPGHPQSPIVDVHQVRTHTAAASQSLAAIEIDAKAMRATWRELLPLIAAAPFPDAPDPAWRYHFDMPGFGRGDACLLHAMLRHHQPRRYVEVGAGHWSGCAVDTIDRYLADRVELCFIEPEIERLRSCVGEARLQQATHLACPVQDADPGIFARLEAGDILFASTGHVLKTGSDLACLLFDVLPALRPGVLVQLHGAFWPFEYNPRWIFEDNRSWNEIYALRAYLMYNDAFEVVFFNDYLARTARDMIQADCPALLRNAGASLWLCKRHD